LKLSLQRLTGCKTMSRSSDTSPPIVKRERVSKNVLVLLVSSTSKVNPQGPYVPRGHNTNKTLHSRCQSASRNGVIHSKFRKNKVKPDSSGIHNSHLGDGGDRRDRTDDLKLAKLPLYQLSYVPSSQSSRRSGQSRVATMVGLGGLEPPTSRLSSARSNQLSYRP
jgi:hypothetical protein